jgi:hypothetical protein
MRTALFGLTAALLLSAGGACSDSQGAGDGAPGRDAATDRGSRPDAAGDADGAGARDARGEVVPCGNKDCNDHLPCTEDICVATGCVNKLRTGWCLIGGACYRQGQRQSSGSCHVCRPSASSSGWTADTRLCPDDGLSCTNTTCQRGTCQDEIAAGYCAVDRACLKHGQADAKNSCRYCNTALSRTALQTRIDGSPCAADALSCTDDVCKAGACKHPLKAGGCLIGGVCYLQGELHPTQDCRECRPSGSTSAWSTAADGTLCTADSLSCTLDVCKAGSCSHPLGAGSCLIGGTCYSDGAANPAAACQQCRTGNSTGAWSARPDGTGCPGDAYPCTSDQCQGGACVHPLLGNRCLIGGTCYNSGDLKPGSDCTGCVPAKSTSNWSLVADGSSCTSDGLSCTSDVCKTGYCEHLQIPNTCLVAGACYLLGDKAPGIECRYCEPSRSSVAWSPMPNGARCSGGECLGGNCCPGCISASTCMPGTSPTACGTGGGPCKTCPSGWFCVAGNCSSTTVQVLNVGPYSSTYSAAMARGYWFVAPVSFTIVALRVPTDVGTAVQNIQVMRFTSAPPSYPTTTTSFTTLAYYRGIPGSGWINTSIPVTAGQIIGILGARGTTTLYNSYGSGNPYSTYLHGRAVSLRRLVYQANLYTTRAGPVSTESGGSYSRVEMMYQ